MVKTMKTGRIVILSVVGCVMFIISACAHRVPAPDNSAHGVLAIPVHVTISTPHVHRFVKYFRFTSSVDPQIDFVFYPERNSTFAFGNTLPPGRYSLDKIIVIQRDSQTTFSHSNKREFYLNNPISFNIESGKVTIVNKIFKLEQYKVEDELFRTRYEIADISNTDRHIWLENFLQMENSELWGIAGDS